MMTLETLLVSLTNPQENQMYISFYSIYVFMSTIICVYKLYTYSYVKYIYISYTSTLIFLYIINISFSHTQPSIIWEARRQPYPSAPGNCLPTIRATEEVDVGRRVGRLRKGAVGGTYPGKEKHGICFIWGSGWVI